ATWSACAIATVVRPVWAKVLVFLYPCFTVFAIVVTANHYYLDAIAGLVLLGISALIAHPLTAAMDRRALNRGRHSVQVTPPPGSRDQAAGRTAAVER
ncbi:MAG TPA: phosphatase PAP2 family protein, partial [Acidimicrobiales bacterium]|nr:phosphatase PAP2 family protein [Acidimicrobiales bacterium]